MTTASIRDGATELYFALEGKLRRDVAMRRYEVIAARTRAERIAAAEAQETMLASGLEYREALARFPRGDADE